MTLSDFFAMGGYAFYVWAAYGGAALVLLIEVVAVRARLKSARDGATAGEDAP